MRRRITTLSAAVACLLAVGAGPATALPGMDLPGSDLTAKGNAKAFELAGRSAPSTEREASSQAATAAATPKAPTKTTPKPSSPAVTAERDEHDDGVPGLRTVRRIAWISPELSATTAARCTAVSCTQFSHGRARWPLRSDGSFVAEYRYNDMGRPAWAPSATVVRQAARDGAREWTRWNPKVNIVDVGTTTAIPGVEVAGSCDDGVNTVGWRALGRGALGVTTVCYDPKTMEIHDVDTALNSLLRWEDFLAAEPGAKAFDLRSVLTHEFGHWMSLHDIYSRSDRPLTMYGSALPGQISQRTLALGDVLGSRSAYPCLPTDGCTIDGIADD